MWPRGLKVLASISKFSYGTRWPSIIRYSAVTNKRFTASRTLTATDSLVYTYCMFAIKQDGRLCFSLSTIDKWTQQFQAGLVQRPGSKYHWISSDVLSVWCHHTRNRKLICDAFMPFVRAPTPLEVACSACKSITTNHSITCYFHFVSF